MAKTARAFSLAALIMLVFVATPSVVLWYMPSLAASLAEAGVDVNNYVVTFALIGITSATLVFVKNMVDEWSALNLAASIAMEFVGFYLFLFLIGLGDATGMGLTERRLNVGGPAGRQAFMFMDLRFFVMMYLAVIAVVALKDFLGFYYSRKECRTKKTTSVSVFCIECGAENPTANKYCGKCGKRLVAIE